MVNFVLPKKSPTSHLLFPVILKVKINIGETIGVKIFEGKEIMGIVDEICEDGEHFWLRATQDPNSRRERFNFKIDQVIKLS